MGGTLLGRVGGLGFEFVFIEDDGREEANGSCVHGRKFEVDH